MKEIQELINIILIKSELIEEKINDPFLLLEEHYFTAVLLHNKIYKVQFEDLSHEVLKFFFEP